MVDHMGYMLESDGLTRLDFDRLLKVIALGKGLGQAFRALSSRARWKFFPSATARCGGHGRRSSSRDIWGSDWPHIPDGDRDTGELLNLLATWVPDTAAMARVLVSNPARLFGFNE